MTDVPFGFGFGPSPARREARRGSVRVAAVLPDDFRSAGLRPSLGVRHHDLAGKAAVRRAAADAVRGRAARSTGTWPARSPSLQLRDDPAVATPQPSAAVEEAVRLADLWLDGATSLPSGCRLGRGVEPRGVGRGDPAGLEAARRPGRRAGGRAMGDVLPEEMQAMAGPLIGMMRSMGGAMFGGRSGRRWARSRGEVVGSTDIGLPLGPAGKAALLPAEHRRRSARAWSARRTRCGCTWRCARPPTSGSSRTCRGCARTCSAPSRRTRAASRSTRASWRTWSASSTRRNPEQLQEALQQGMFQPEDTPEQKAALARLETALALVEGWVDDVVHAAAADRLPAAAALRETLRRRRADRWAGRADLRHADRAGAASAPAARRRRAVGLAGRARGVDGRDALWAHPDMLPSATTWTTRTASSRRPRTFPDFPPDDPLAA